ncbi:hypothetical protein [Ruegeria sp. YS9]|nr:hypothetical protein [Ruegeria sp. YS9]UUV05580.1 hypothetical protein NOR97_13260 [Ruegeria sp. YS9]
MRKFIVTVCALVLIIVIGMHLLLFTPFRLPPEIGRELPSSFSEADKEFARRIATEFRLPLNERELVRNLKQKGFSVFDEKD